MRPSPDRSSLAKDKLQLGSHNYPDKSDSDASNNEAKSGLYDWYGDESKEQIEISRDAAKILDNPELLMMHAASRGDSVPATRLYFSKLMCGYGGLDSENKKDKIRK